MDHCVFIVGGFVSYRIEEYQRVVCFSARGSSVALLLRSLRKKCGKTIDHVPSLSRSTFHAASSTALHEQQCVKTSVPRELASKKSFFVKPPRAPR